MFSGTKILILFHSLGKRDVKKGSLTVAQFQNFKRENMKSVFCFAFNFSILLNIYIKLLI